MKAWVFDSFGGSEKLSLKEVSDLKAGVGEAIIDVKTAGVNPVDRSTIAGRFDWIKTPFTTGAEFAGVVTSVGEGVDGVKPGMRVVVNSKLFCGKCKNCLMGEDNACLSNKYIERAPYIVGVFREGGWRESADLPAQNLIPIPDSLSFRDACTLSVDGATAWRLVKRARPKMNDFALVVGATGGVGSFAVQIAKLYGCEVAAVVSDQAQAQKMKAIGADHIISRKEGKISESVKQLTEGRGADVVIDPLGSATFESSYKSLATLGRYATCGTLTGVKTELSILHLYSMQVEFIGSTTFSRADMMDVVSATARGKLKPQIDSVFKFEELQSAMSRLDVHGRFGKVLVERS